MDFSSRLKTEIEIEKIQAFPRTRWFNYLPFFRDRKRRQIDALILHMRAIGNEVVGIEYGGIWKRGYLLLKHS